MQAPEAAGTRPPVCVPADTPNPQGSAITEAPESGPWATGAVQQQHSSVVYATLAADKAWVASVRQEILAMELELDPYSNAKPDEARVTHIDWSVTVGQKQMESKKLECIAKLTYENLKNVTTLNLDQTGLQVKSVKIAGEPVNYGCMETGKNEEGERYRGDWLWIDIPSNQGRGIVEIEYETAPEAAGLYWKSADQTEGGQPMMYSLAQFTEAPSFLPCQDTPGVRCPVTMHVQTEPGFMALASSSQNPTEIDGSGSYTIDCQTPIPSYLISLVAGGFEYHKLGQVGETAIGVYCQKGLGGQAQDAFSKIPEIFQTHLQMTGPYRWGPQYAVTVATKAFPFGAMEHPCNSLIGGSYMKPGGRGSTVVTHELSHEKTGNLVGNANWNFWWFNEGFTSGLEYLESCRTLGKEAATIEFANKAMRMAIGLPYSLENDQRLCRTFDKKPVPVTLVPYVKGALFMLTLKEKLGINWGKYFQHYQEVFAFNVIDDERFKEFTKKWLAKYGIQLDLEADLKVDEWFYGTGIPDNAVQIEPESTLASFTRFFEEGKVDLEVPSTQADETAKTLYNTQRIYFFNKLAVEAQDAFVSGMPAKQEQVQQRVRDLAKAWSPSTCDLQERGPWCMVLANARVLGLEDRETIKTTLIERQNVYFTTMVINALCDDSQGEGVNFARELVGTFKTSEGFSARCLTAAESILKARLNPS